MDYYKKLHGIAPLVDKTISFNISYYGNYELIYCNENYFQYIDFSGYRHRDVYKKVIKLLKIARNKRRIK